MEVLHLTEKILDLGLRKWLRQISSVCSAGENATDGSMNGGFGCFEPTMVTVPDTEAWRENRERKTKQILLENTEEIAAHAADLYFVAIRTNN